MAGKAKNGKLLLKVIVLLLVIVFLVSAFMLVRKLSNNFTDDVKTFYIVIDGETITDNKTNISLLGKKIEVHSLGADRTFTYKIVPKASKNFKFMANGVEHAFTDKSDYTSGFGIETKNNSLEIGTIGLLDVLNNVYKATIELPYLNTQACYFTLIVGNADGSKSINLDFFVEVVNITPADGIQLDITEILF